MPRPTTQASSQRQLQNPEAVSAPGLEVNAQIIAPRAQPNGWDALKGALLYGSELAGITKRQEDANAPLWEKQAEADAAAGTVNDEWERKHVAYHDGVVATKATIEAHGALQDIRQEIDQTVDKTLPVDQYNAAVDDIVRKHFAPMTTDPLVRRVVFPQVQSFYEQESASHVTGLIKQHQEDAVNALGLRLQDIADGGPGSEPENLSRTIQNLVEQTASVTGDRSAAWDAVGQFASKLAGQRGDMSIWDQLVPDKFTDANGKEVASPKFSARFETYKAQAQQAVTRYNENVNKPALMAAQLSYLHPFDERAEKGDIIGIHEFDQGFKDNLITMDQARSLINKSAEVRARQSEQNDKDAQIQARMDAVGTKTALDVIGTPVGKGEKQTLGRDEAVGFMTRKYLEPAFQQMLGRPAGFKDFLQDEGFRDQALLLATRMKVPLDVLKGGLAAYGPQDAAGAFAALPLVNSLRAKGVAGDYLSEKQQAMYESMQGDIEAGMSKETIVSRLKDATSGAYRDQVAQARPQVLKLLSSVSVNSVDAFSDQAIGDFAPASKMFAQSKLQELAMHFVSLGQTPEASVENAKNMFGQRYMVSNLNGYNVVLPKDGRYSPEDVQGAFDYYKASAIAEAKKSGDPHADQASIQFIPASNGHPPVGQAVDSLGNPVGPQLDLDKAIAQARSARPDAYDQVHKAAATRKQWTEDFNKANDAMPKPGTSSAHFY